MTHLLCIGHLNVEDTKYVGRNTVWKAPGGAALYSSVAARIWGIDVSLVSRVGENYPEIFLKTLKNNGINISNLIHVQGLTMAGMTSYDDFGERTYRMYSDAPRRLKLTPMPEDIKIDKTMNVDGAHVATMPPYIQKMWIEKLLGLINFISLDTDISFIISDRASFIDLLKKVNAVFPNRSEAEALFPNKTLKEVANSILEIGPEIVAIKCGEDGALIQSRELNEPIIIPAIKKKIVDVTGAGDSFAGGFLAGYLQNHDVFRAGRMGTISASISIQDYGGLHSLGKINDPDILTHINYN